MYKSICLPCLPPSFLVLITSLPKVKSCQLTAFVLLGLCSWKVTIQKSKSSNTCERNSSTIGLSQRSYTHVTMFHVIFKDNSILGLSLLRVTLLRTRTAPSREKTAQNEFECCLESSNHAKQANKIDSKNCSVMKSNAFSFPF